MNQTTSRVSRSGHRTQLTAVCFPVVNRAEFYRDELLRHQRCLDRQREYFSEQAIHNVENALRSLLARLDTLCRQQDCDRVMSALLKKFDLVTRLSVWDEYGRTH